MLQHTHFIVNQAVTSHVRLQYMFLLDRFDCHHTVELCLDNCNVQNVGLLPIALRPFQFGLGFLYMVSEQYSFPGWGCQPHAHPQLSWRTDDFLSGLSPLADPSRF